MNPSSRRRKIRTDNTLIENRICYTPANSAPLNTLMGKVSTMLQLDAAVPYATSADLVRGMKRRSMLAGLDFSETSTGGAGLPKHLHYALRFPSELRTGDKLMPHNNWQTNRMYPVSVDHGPRQPQFNDGGPGYYREGFIAIQHAVAKTFLAEHDAAKPWPELKLQRFPFRPYVDDHFLILLDSLIGVVLTLSFVYPVMNTVKFITEEKELQLKEMMMIMGLPNWMHWTGWFIRSLASLTVSVSLITVLLKVPWYQNATQVAVLTHSSWSALYVVLLVYVVVTIGFCFLLSVFFTQANTAAAVSGIAFFLVYCVYVYANSMYETMSLETKLALSLMSNTGMAMGFRVSG